LSNFVQHELEAQMSERHVLKYFKHISGNLAFNEVEHSRTTKRERLEATLSAYDVSASFIIGDSLEEPEIARHYGMRAFSVTWGCFSPARLHKGGTDHLIDELAEVSEILQKQGI
jgi:phosphoglycolate phosphatase-like HAD superfamily hydrolase